MNKKIMRTLSLLMAAAMISTSLKLEVFAHEAASTMIFSISAATLTESGVPGDGWKQSVKKGSFGMNTYYFTEDYKHEVTIDWGDGRIEKFTMVPSPNQQALYPLQYIDEINYVAQGNSTSKLQPIGSNKDFIFTSDGLYDYNFSIYNPKQYKLTTLDGTVYIFDDEEGIQEIQNVMESIPSPVTYGDTSSNP